MSRITAVDTVNYPVFPPPEPYFQLNALPTPPPAQVPFPGDSGTSCTTQEDKLTGVLSLGQSSQAVAWELRASRFKDWAMQRVQSAQLMGFETLASWSTTTSGAVLSLSPTHSQGVSSLALRPSNSNGFTPMRSVPLSTLTVVSPTLAWDVMLPTQQPNPTWQGTAQTYVNCPSRGIYSAFLGQVELTGKPLNVWNTITFPLNNDQVTRLLQSGYSDLTFTVVVNVQVPTSGTYRVDNLRFVPVAGNACGGRPNGTACTDGNACTQLDRCQNGTCQAGTPVACTG